MAAKTKIIKKDHKLDSETRDKYYKIVNKLSDQDVEKYREEFFKDSSSFTVSFKIDCNPDQYVMARMTKNHFYNPKSDIEVQYHRAALNNISKDDYNKIQEVINSGKLFNVECKLKFYIRVNKNLNKTQLILYENKIMQPIAKRDCDNMAKLFLDSMHDLMYPDDCYITKLSVEKYCAIDPRIEAEFTYIVFNHDDKQSRLKKLKEMEE